MGARVLNGTTQSIVAGATGYGTELTSKGYTLAAVAYVTALPGAGVFDTCVGLFSATGARVISIYLAGDAPADGWVVDTGTATSRTFSVAPPTNAWFLIAIAKATGTATPYMFQYQFDTATVSTANGSGTQADRTAGVVTLSVGSFNGADFWPGRFARAAVFNRNLSVDEMRQLVYPGAWRGLQRDNLGADLDLTWKTGTLALDYYNPALNFNGGTDPGMSPGGPPGW